MLSVMINTSNATFFGDAATSSGETGRFFAVLIELHSPLCCKEFHKNNLKSEGF